MTPTYLRHCFITRIFYSIGAVLEAEMNNGVTSVERTEKTTLCGMGEYSHPLVFTGNRFQNPWMLKSLI